jgi:hypothetical protein
MFEKKILAISSILASLLLVVSSTTTPMANAQLAGTQDSLGVTDNSDDTVATSTGQFGTQSFSINQVDVASVAKKKQLVADVNSELKEKLSTDGQGTVLLYNVETGRTQKVKVNSEADLAKVNSLISASASNSGKTNSISANCYWYYIYFKGWAYLYGYGWYYIYFYGWACL